MLVFTIVINSVVLLGNSFLLYKLTPIYREWLRHQQNEQELNIQKVEMLMLDLTKRVKERREEHSTSEERYVYE